MTPDDIAELLTKVLGSLDLELDDLEIIKAGKRRVVRVTVDGDGANGSGPDMDEIADASRAVSAALDEADAMGEAPYVLEVGTRGVSTPLRRPAHFRRRIGRLVRITTESDSVIGRLVGADDQSVTLEVDGHQHTIDYSTIVKAVVQVEMNRKDNDSEEEDE